MKSVLFAFFVIVMGSQAFANPYHSVCEDAYTKKTRTLTTEVRDYTYTEGKRWTDFGFFNMSADALYADLRKAEANLESGKVTGDRGDLENIKNAIKFLDTTKVDPANIDIMRYTVEVAVNLKKKPGYSTVIFFYGIAIVDNTTCNPLVMPFKYNDKMVAGSLGESVTEIDDEGRAW